MTLHDQIGEINTDTEDLSSYVEHLECYFVVNDVDDSRKPHAILLSCCGAATYGLIRSLATPSKPTAVSYQELVKRVMAHFNKIVSRFKFNSRSQQPGKPIAAYASELWKLSKFCEFGESLDNVLCDWLVSGLAEQRVQQNLLQEETLPLTGP